MHDSGKREQFETGAVRDTAEGKARIDLISPYAQMRKGQWLRKGAEKYDERNWEKGMKISRCIASLERHIQEYKMGLTNEDHLAAIAVNAEFIMHYEKMIEMGLLPKELDDMPKYEQVEITSKGEAIQITPQQQFERKLSTEMIAAKRGAIITDGCIIEHVNQRGWRIRLANGKFLGIYMISLDIGNAFAESTVPYYYKAKPIAEEHLADYLRNKS